MSILKTLILGRENGIRRGLLRAILGGGGPPDTSPNSSYSAPAPAAPPPAEVALGLQPEAPKDITPPEGFEVVLHKDALAPGKITEIIIGGKAIAVANVDGEFHACTNSCPHAEGPLGEGTLRGSVLACPYHGWEFDIVGGTCLTNPDVELETFEVQIEGDAVCVRV